MLADTFIIRDKTMSDELITQYQAAIDGLRAVLTLQDKENAVLRRQLLKIHYHFIQVLKRYAEIAALYSAKEKSEREPEEPVCPPRL